MDIHILNLKIQRNLIITPLFFKMAYLNGESTDSCNVTHDKLKYIDEHALAERPSASRPL